MAKTYAIAFAAALGGALLATPVVRRMAFRFGVFDVPTERKLHTDPTPYLGGVGIILAFAAAVLAGGLARGLGGSYLQVGAILGGGLLLAAMGLWDDLRVVPGWIKVPAEMALGTALFAAGVRVELFRAWLPDLVLTLGWVVGITNAVNYLDNMDGLTAGVSAIASVYFFALAALSGQVLVAGFAAALAGCALGFLWYNRPPARIFMGDAGSLFLGFLLAALGLKLRFRNIERVTFFVPVAVMAVPILDALMVSISRVSRGLSPIRPGKDHASHRLVLVGIPSKATVGLLWFAAAACGWIGVVIAYAQPVTAYLLIGWLIAVGVFLGALLLRVEVGDP
jgi:UDP-GlcNAc:undecaprenyl-phosphate GlcNAc-1-phosphate transferase